MVYAFVVIFSLFLVFFFDGSVHVSSAPSYYRMCSLIIECVLLLSNVFSYHRMCSLTMSSAPSYYRMCSLIIECVLIECLAHPLILECVLLL